MFLVYINTQWGPCWCYRGNELGGGLLVLSVGEYVSTYGEVHVQ